MRSKSAGKAAAAIRVSEPLAVTVPSFDKIFQAKDFWSLLPTLLINRRIFCAAGSVFVAIVAGRGPLVSSATALAICQ